MHDLGKLISLLIDRLDLEFRHWCGGGRKIYYRGSRENSWCWHNMV